MVEVLKQPPYSPLSAEEQVLIISAGNFGLLDDMPVGNVTKFEAELYPFIEAKYPEILESIRTEKKVTDETNEKMEKAIGEFKSTFSVA
jgi:F-type H+-transporting ATPase subunit alpha